MSSFSDKDATYFSRKLGGYGKPGAGDGLKANGLDRGESETKPVFDLDRQLKRDEYEDTILERYPTNYPEIALPDELNGFARDIRLMPATLVARLQQELFECLPRWMPARERLVARLWQLLFVWSLKKWESQNVPPPRSPISMEALSAAIMPNGLENPNGEPAEETQTQPRYPKE